MRAVFIALFFSLLCGRAGAHFTEPRLLGEDARPFTQATKRDEARGFKDERLGLTEETQTKVLWAGWLPLMEERTRTVSGEITGVTTRRWFQWGADLSGTLEGAGGIGGLVGIIEEDGAGVVTRTLLPVQDGLGNITAVIDQATGRTVAGYDYGPFGEPLAESGEVDACPFRWQTKWYDAESQHYYFGYRHYDPRFGRWLSRDPLGEAGGFNLYAYCGNDPVNRHDPLGLAAVVDDPENPFGSPLGRQRRLEHQMWFGTRQSAKWDTEFEQNLWELVNDGFVPEKNPLREIPDTFYSVLPSAAVARDFTDIGLDIKNDWNHGTYLHRQGKPGALGYRVGAVVKTMLNVALALDGLGGVIEGCIAKGGVRTVAANNGAKPFAMGISPRTVRPGSAERQFLFHGAQTASAENILLNGLVREAAEATMSFAAKKEGFWLSPYQHAAESYGPSVLMIDRSLIEEFIESRIGAQSEQEFLILFEHFDKIPRSAFELLH